MGKEVVEFGGCLMLLIFLCFFLNVEGAFAWDPCVVSSFLYNN